MNKILQQDIEAFASAYPRHAALQGKCFLVTGATGLLGSCLVKCLLALSRHHNLGLRLIAMVRSEAKFRQVFGEDTEGVSCVVHDFSSTTPFTLEEVPDHIIHLASPTASQYFMTHPVDTMKVGIGSTQQLLDYATEHHASMLYVSSLEVYGVVLDDSRPVEESDQGYLDPIAVRSSYPMTKRAAECMCHAYAAQYGTQVRIARLAQTFGAGIAADDNRVFAQFARSVMRKEDIILHTRGELCRSYCYTTDAVAAMLTILIDGNVGEAYNVVNADTYISIIDMAHLVCQKFSPGHRPVIQLQEGMGYSPVTKLRLSDSKLRALGWSPQYDLETMFARLIAYLEETDSSKKVS